MSFEAPALLLGLLLVPLAAAGYWFLQRRRAAYAVRFTNLSVLAAVAGKRNTWKRHVPAALMLLALTALCVAFARPTITVKTPDERASVVLVVDVSGSMRATDVKPTRLAAAKQRDAHVPRTLARHPSRRRRRLLRRAAGGRLADRRPQGAHPGDRAPRPGLRHRDRRCARARGRPRADGDRRDRGRPRRRRSRTRRGASLASILLLSDGAQTRGLLSPGQGAQRAQTAGIPVFTIALGTDEGSIMAGPPGQEQLIPVPPDRETLAAIAEYTGAESFDARERRRRREGLQRARLTGRAPGSPARGDVGVRRGRGAAPGRRGRRGDRRRTAPAVASSSSDGPSSTQRGA